MSDSLPILYKFHKYNQHLYELLLSSRFYCATHEELNDPFDLRFKISQTFLETLYIRQGYLGSINVVDSLIKFQKFVHPSDQTIDSDLLIEKTIAFIMKNRQNQQDFIEALSELVEWRVISFQCERKDKNFRMWSQYTDSFRGVRMKFDFNNDLNFGFPSDEILRVTYDKMKEIIYIEDFKDALFCKSKDWRTEKEYRYLQVQEKFKSFDQKSLKEITFGCNLNQDQVYSITRLCKMFYPDCKYYWLMQTVDNLQSVEIDVDENLMIYKKNKDQLEEFRMV